MLNITFFQKYLDIQMCAGTFQQCMSQNGQWDIKGDHLNTNKSQFLIVNYFG